jgi:hypothetical protein
MAPKSKSKKAAASEDSGNESPVEVPVSAKQTSDPTRTVFGVDLDDPRDVEDDQTALVPVAKYAILAMICLMSFAIRLFAVVRYESVSAKRPFRRKSMPWERYSTS